MEDVTPAEIWRSTHTSDRYEVSNRGRVRNTMTGHVLKPYVRLDRPTKRYEVVSPGKPCVGVHVLVCVAFHGPRPTPRHCVAHTNGDSLDNRAENLRWATYRENHEDQLRHGTHFSPPHMVGSDHGCAVLDEDMVRNIRRAYEVGGITRSALGDQYGVSKGAIDMILSRKTWRHVHD